MTKEGQQVTSVWQNGGRSAKLNISNSIRHLCKIQADVFQMPPLRQAVNR
jgi:hypothetical protein